MSNSPIYGTGGDDALYGTGGNDKAYGESGNDIIEGKGGDDELYGNGGNDTIKGEEGDDTVLGHPGDDSIEGNAGDDLLSGDPGDDLVSGGEGYDTLYGGAGDDKLYGGDDDDIIDDGAGDDILEGNTGNDTLRGRGGEDELIGGDGDDLIISYSDAGEPDIAQDTDQPKVYSEQPFLEAHDTLTGGTGADTFEFKLLINAKDKIIQKHADPATGRINWQGVAGENDNPHDHWVDAIGNDVILDFNKSEGDKIKILGHTVQVKEIKNLDNGNGSIIHLISNQGGNGGAHDQDELGTITVYGDIVEQSDLTVRAGVTFGVLHSIPISDINTEQMPMSMMMGSDGSSCHMPM